MKQWMIASALALTAMAAAPVDALAQQDAWLTMKTKIALMTADNVNTSELNVDTVAGAVTLHGKVETTAEKANAELVAKGIDGVKSVQNLLQVVPASKEKMTEVADKDIDDRVKAAFKADTMMKDSGIDVTSVNKGVVLLSGRAKTIDAHLKAIEMAKSVSGVRRVATQVTMMESR
ncbi:MAG: BON domain-containing protein [Acidobacteria bacterium]|nr:BON domain-containing protein [Acidobacteriota bacterium]